MATPHCKVLNGVLTSKIQSKSPIEGRNEVWKQPRTPSPEWSTTIKKILLYFFLSGVSAGVKSNPVNILARCWNSETSPSFCLVYGAMPHSIMVTPVVCRFKGTEVDERR